MNRSLLIPVALTATLTLAGCAGNPQKATTKNFNAALQAVLDTQPACIIVSVPKNTEDRGGVHQFDESLEVLVRAGLVGRSEMQVHRVPDTFSAAKPVPGLHYQLTTEGLRFTRKDIEIPPSPDGPRTSLCFARKQLVRVVRFTQPGATMGRTISEVTYTYKLVDVAGWAKLPQIQARYVMKPDLRALESQDENRMALELTRDGWRRPGL